MKNAYPFPAKDRIPAKNRIPRPQLQCDEDSSDADLDTDVIALLEENARLRALVTQLSDLVLRHVVDQK